MKITGYFRDSSRNHSDFVRLFVLVVYFLVVGFLAIFSFSPIGGEAGYILARLIPHLFYIPLVLTALWYPDKKLAHSVIFSLIFISLVSGFLINGWSLDALFMVFTSFIYLWVFIAILAIPKAGVEGSAEDATGIVESVETISQPAESPTPCHVLSPDLSSIPSSQINPLIESFRLGDPTVTKKTSAALKAIGSPAIPFITLGLRSNSIPIRENCARLLGEMGGSDSVNLLLKSMGDRSRRVHNAATQAIAKSGESAVPALLEGLGNENWKIRAGSVVALRIIGLQDTIPLLIEMLDDKSHYVRKEVVKSLARIGRDEIIDSLVMMLDDESRGVRIAAVGGLGRSGMQEAVLPLRKVMEEEKDAEVRIRAVHSLELIGTTAAFEAIRSALSDGDPEVISAACDILKQNYKI